MLKPIVLARPVISWQDLNGGRLRQGPSRGEQLRTESRLIFPFQVFDTRFPLCGCSSRVSHSSDAQSMRVERFNCRIEKGPDFPGPIFSPATTSLSVFRFPGSSRFDHLPCRALGTFFLGTHQSAQLKKLTTRRNQSKVCGR
jgi:hypothetical protein